MKFFRDITVNKSLLELNLAVLKVLDVSANNFAEDYEILKNGFYKNISLSKMEIRECKFKNRKNNPNFLLKKLI